MPDRSTIKKAKQDKEEGKSASTQAGEFIHDEIEKVKQGKHGVRSVKQAIAIGLSEARSAGIDLPAPKTGGAALQKKAKQDEARAGKAISPVRSKATVKALQKEPTDTITPKSLSKQAKSAAAKRSADDRSASAKKAAKTRAKNEGK